MKVNAEERMEHRERVTAGTGRLDRRERLVKALETRKDNALGKTENEKKKTKKRSSFLIFLRAR